MRMSRLFFRTLRDAPVEADTPGHSLLLRGGFVQRLGAGLFDLLPLGLRVKRKIENVLREELNALGAQEVSFPLVQPADLWERSGRQDTVDEVMVRFSDRAGRALCLGVTHEEVAADAARHTVCSYRQLPVTLYQLGTKFRDELRSRGGLVRTREFTMNDAYSFHTDGESLDATYREMHGVYRRIFARLGLPVVAVESDMGMMGGDTDSASGAHEFMVLTPMGEDTLLLCPGCDYKANRQVARFSKPSVPAEEMGEVTLVHTPDTKTIDALTDLLNVPKSRTGKAVFFVAESKTGGEARERFVFALLRGDMALSETKLSAQIGAQSMRPATEEEIRRVGAEPGYASPIGVAEEVLLVVDDAVATSPNLVAGANRAGYHLMNTNYGRDYEADLIADIAAASKGDACPSCGAEMVTRRGVEVGNIFKLGTTYSEALGATYLDSGGAARPIVMGSYGIGVERTLACVAETHHDDAGLCWPVNVAPYQVALISLGGTRFPEVTEVAEVLYRNFVAAGFETLFNDRDESAGVKFSDADLLGLPFRVTVGRKGLADGVAEVKVRRTGEVERVELTSLVGVLETKLADLRREEVRQAETYAPLAPFQVG